MTASLDGLTIFASSFGSVGIESGDYARKPWSFWDLRGGGLLRRFDIGAFIKQKVHSPPVFWAARRCTLEDEQQGARNIAVVNKPHPLKFVIPLSDLQRRLVSEANEKSPCVSNDANVPAYYANALKNRGRADNDTIWVDRWDKLEQINPANGTVLRVAATPRSKSVCSIPLYDRRQFINRQGDTVSLGPLAEGTKLGERKVLASKPGWSIEGIEMFGERIGVRWIDNRFRHHDTQQMGSALAVLYDLASLQAYRIDD